MNQFTHPIKLVKQLAFLFFLLVGINQLSRAQAPTISYPTAAQNLSRGSGDSLLTVKLVFNGVCSGTVRLGLPASVTYVPGSVIKTSGTASVTIAESSIADLSKPTFSISGVAAIGDEITFTVARRAGCGSLATAKDSVYFVAGAGCSDGSEIAGTVNTYNIFAPTLPITPAAALTGAVVGSTYSRTTVVTNGGNGPTDTVRFYIVYPSAGIANSSGTNAVTANGVSFTPSSTSGDTLFYKIFGTTIFGGDNLLTSGETVTVVEPIRVLKCNTTTTYGACWGRSDAALCEKATATSAMTMAAGVPNLSLAFARVSEGNLCTGDVWQYTLTNTGSESASGAGAAMNIIANLGTSYWPTPSIPSNQYAWVGLGSFNVNGTLLTSTVGTGGMNIVPLGQLTADPDGAGGLTDLDGDGQFDDLPVGASVVLRYSLTWDCSLFPTTCNTGNSDVTPNARFYFKNQCGTDFDRFNTAPISTLRYVVTPGNTATVTGPTDVVGGATFRPELCFYTQPENNWPANSVNGTLRTVFTLPTGFSLVGTGSPTISVDGGAPVAITATVSGSTVTFERPHLLGSHTLCFSFNVTTDCATIVPGPTNIGYAITYLNNPTTCPTCVWNYNCGNYNVVVHCPCTSPVGVNNNIIPVATRTTLGWTDNTLSTKVLPGAVSANALKILIPRDSAQVTFGGTQFPGASYTNLHFKYSFDEAPTTASYLNYSGGTITITKAIGGTVYNCSLPTPSIVYASGKYTWNFDISTLIGGCLPSGFSFEPGDVYSADFKVFYNGTYTIGGSVAQLPGSEMYFYNLSGATELFCDKYGNELYLLPVLKTTSYNFNGLTSGCTNTTTNSIMGIGFNGSGDYFPEEFRPGRYMDSFRVIVPAGVKYDNTSNASLRAITASGSYSTFAIGAPIIRGDTLIFVNPGTWELGDLAKITTYANYSISVPVTSSCEITPGTYQYRMQAFVRDFYYSYNLSPTPAIPSTALAPQIQVNVTSAPVAYGNKPSTTVANLSGTVQGVNVNQSWDVRITSSGTTQSPYVWMALEQGLGSGNIIVDSVKLLPSLTTITPTSTYNGTDKWYQISTAGLASGASQQARVFFRYTSCTPDSILFKSGWNCSGYPSPNPLSYPCTASSTYLKVEPQPSQVQLSVLRQPGGGSSIDLCTVDSALLVLNSAQAANLVNPYVTFFPPAGLTLVTPIQVEYPRGSGDYQNATVTSLPGGGYQINLNAHTAIGTSGMFGTANASPSYVPLGGDREAKIKMNFTTDCSYTSGTSFTFNAYGNRPCGAPAIDNGVAATTSKLDITGASAAGGAGVTISFGGSPTTLGCGTTVVTLSLITTPTSLGTTAGDTMTYTLPVGMGYAGNLTSGYSATVTGGAGAPTIVKVAMPTGVAAGTAISFNFDVVPQGGGCGSVNIMGAYQRRIASLFCGATACASSSVVISTATSPNITLVKPSLVISDIQLLDTPAWRQANYYANHVKVFYSNNGTQAYSANTDTIEYFCNASATVPFAKMPLTKALAIGASDSDEYYLMMPIGSCSPGDVIVSRIQTQTAGGTAQCLCSPSSFVSAGVGLPLTFLGVSTKVQDCAVNLSWSYNITDNSDLNSFIIERSNNGVQYNTVATLKPSVTNYIDVTPNSGKWFYRIKAIGVQGKAAYSPTQTANTMQCVGNRVKVYPNPANEQLQIVLQGSSNNNRFELIDALGRVLLQGVLNNNTNNKLDVSGLVRGTYLVKVITDDNVTMHQVQILK